MLKYEYKMSICMMVKDEEKNLIRCLDKLKPLTELGIAELIIVDTGSKDNTVFIAESYTDKIYFHKWNNDFSKMRNKTISYAKGEWIFIIDADEELINADELIRLVKTKDINSYNTIIFQIRNFNNLSREDVAAMNPSPRLFKNDGEFKYLGSVHNQPLFKTPVKTTNIVLNHYGYILDDKELMEKKFIRTKSILEKELSQNPNNDYYQFQLGVTYDMHGDKKEAYIEFKRAYNMIKDKPYEYKQKRIYIYSSFARSASLNKMYDDVIAVCNEGINLRNDFVDLYYILAATQRVTGRYEDSISNLTTYINLIENFENLEISKDLTISFYNIDEASLESAYLNLFLNYFDIGDYIKAKDCIHYIKNESKKIYCYGLLIQYMEIDLELMNFYNSMDLNNRIALSEIIENEMKNFDQQKQIRIRSVFSEINDQYGIYNKIMLESNNYNSEKLYDVMLSLINKIDINQAPDYFGNLIYFILNKKENIYNILSHISEKNIERFLKYCYVKSKNLPEIIKECLSDSKNLDDYNLDTLRITKNLLKSILIFNEDTKPLKEIFYLYLKIGIEYIDKIYRTEIIEDEMIYNVDEESGFFILMHKAEKFKQSNFKEYVKYLRKTLLVCPYLKDYIEMLSKDVENEINKKNNEFEQYKIEVKNTIKALIENNRLEDAKVIIQDYKKIVLNDIDVFSMEAVIAIMEDRFDKAEQIIKNGINTDPNFGDLYYNLAYINKLNNNKDYLRYLCISYNRIKSEENKLAIKNEIIEAYNIDNRQVSKKISPIRVLIVCHFYSIFSVELIENLYKNYNIEFEMLTMDSNYLGLHSKGIIKNVYVYDKLQQLEKCLESMKKFDIVNIHFVSSFYNTVAKKLKKISNNLICSFWGSDFYRINEVERKEQKIILNEANCITFCNEEMGEKFNSLNKNKYLKKIKFVRFGLAPLNEIKNIKDSKIDVDIIKHELHIPKNKIVVVCGYSSTPAHNHVEIIENLIKLDSDLLSKLFFVFPMTYGDKSYSNKLKAMLEDTNLNYKVFDTYMSNEEVAKLRIISEIMIHVPISDQLSGSMQETLYCGGIVITGSWLPYRVLREKNIRYIEVNKIQEINEKITYAVNNLDELMNQNELNHLKIWKLSSWDKNTEKWFDIYNELTERG
ncbi:glycosyltransferase involved in cell wall biosynthesis [Clostridium pascui]|uniref:glycosyltransferase n=1 Tax=Clostridium pascui TaxID=46609 RepID=UPI00195AE6C3|nr:glycosyltransferase [Clostridium pascui]MBM7869453.1 glycosyltransferase involved in cell wall biosynthesis [Clostridium pascui]